MNIYWSESDIPALKGLSGKEREAAKRAVINKVWKHWQVSLPFLAQLASYIALAAFAPQFPYRLPIMTVAFFLSLKAAALPFHHYLQLHLSSNASSSTPETNSPLENGVGQ